MPKNPVCKYIPAYSLFVYYMVLLQLQLFMSYTIVNHIALFLIQGWMDENIIKEKKNERFYTEDRSISRTCLSEKLYTCKSHICKYNSREKLRWGKKSSVIQTA